MELRIRYRQGNVSDLNECFECARDGFAYDDHLKGMLIDFWKRKLQDGSAILPVIENAANPIGQRIEFFLFLICIDNDFTKYLLTSAPPMLALNIIASERDGNSPILAYDSICRANSHEGVNMACMNSGSPILVREETGPDVDRIARQIVQFQYYASGGYRLRRAVVEFYDELQFKWAEGWGGIVAQDFTNYVHEHPDSLAARSKRPPRLYCVSQADESVRVGTAASQNFNYRPPTFRFTPEEKKQLLNAMTYETDESLARSLCYSIPTIRKRWESIYEKVADTNPQILTGYPDDSAGKQSTPKKWNLIQYIRQHIEEVRPYE